MNILLTGVTGYIGGRLLPSLLDEGHIVYACIRDRARFPQRYLHYKNLRIVEVDFLDMHEESLPKEIDVAYYLIHSMTASLNHFDEMEHRQALNFVEYMNRTTVKQVVYLTGIARGEGLSTHLSSRKHVGDVLSTGQYALTMLRAAVIIGGGSASFEIMYDLVDKLPIMVGPDSLNNKCQPISVINVIYYLREVMLNEQCMNQTFDIGSDDILSYKDMLLAIADVRKLKRRVYTFNWISAKFCARWFYFITSVSYKLSINLSESMKNDVVCGERRIAEIIPQKLLTFREAVEMALEKISADNVLTSWKDSFSSSGIDYKIADNIHIPQTGVLTHSVSRQSLLSKEELINRIWETGGTQGWWYANWLWEARGILDLFGDGIGMRGRTSRKNVTVGSAIDFWRVLIADRERGHLLLYAEMVMPGEGWLDFRVSRKSPSELPMVTVTATFRPKGLRGHLYWLSTKPFHLLIFKGMIKKLTS